LALSKRAKLRHCVLHATAAAMTERYHYVCEFHLDGRRQFVVWYTDDVDGLIRTGDKIAGFASEAEARAFCVANAISLRTGPPELYDFDAITAWCDDPVTDAIDCKVFLNAWNMLGDARGPSHGMPSLFKTSDGRANKIYDKLFFGNNWPAVTPPGEHYDPSWPATEVAALARLLRLGIAELRANVGQPTMTSKKA
jgi:hypothetical protein